MTDRIDFLDEVEELAFDENIFDATTGEQRPDVHLKVLVVSEENVQVLINNFNKNPEIEVIAEGIVDVLRNNGYTYTQVHAILALAGAGVLPRRIVEEQPDERTRKEVVTALNSVAMFHQIAADVAEEGPSQKVPSLSDTMDLDDFIRGLEAAGFVQISPGVWTGKDDGAH